MIPVVTSSRNALPNCAHRVPTPSPVYLSPASCRPPLPIRSSLHRNVRPNITRPVDYFPLAMDTVTHPCWHRLHRPGGNQSAGTPRSQSQKKAVLVPHDKMTSFSTLNPFFLCESIVIDLHTLQDSQAPPSTFILLTSGTLPSLTETIGIC